MMSPFINHFMAEKTAFSIIVPEMKDADLKLWSDNDFKT